MTDETERGAVERLSDLITQEAKAFGPHQLDDEGEPISDKPMPEAALAEWVLVMSWSDPDTGDTFLTRATSHRLARHHENGLLHEALYEFD